MMKILSVLAVLVAVFGLSSAAMAQDVEPEVEVEFEGEVGGEPSAGDTVTVRTKNLDPETEVEIELGETTGSGTADADGVAEVDIVVPDTPGEIDGIVVINGVEVPFSVLVRALDGTAVPSGVNTGDGLGSSNSSGLFYFGAAAVMLLLSGGALALRRHQAAHTSTV